nr:uncharacterized protein LOC127315405 [Lolium perenne]
MEHVTPLAAEVGDPPAHRVWKTPASDAGPSTEPAPKRQKKSSSGPPGRKRKHEIPVATGPALELNRSASGMRPETAKDAGRATPPPQQSPAPSSAGKAPSSPRGGKTSSGRAAPKSKHHRTEEDLTSPPEYEDTGASNMGAGSEEVVQSEPLVPPVLEKKKQASDASPSKTLSIAPPPSSSPAKDAPAPTSASASKPPLAPRKSSRKGTEVTAEQLASAVTAAVAPATGSQALTLHAGRAAKEASEKVLAQLGRIIVMNRGDANLGDLQRYVDKWNLSNLSEATLGVGRDRQVIIDSHSPQNTMQHLGRLKQAVRELDNAWHDAHNNVLGMLDSRKQLFEELLWEHRDLVEAFASLKLTHSQCQAALPEASLDDLTSQIAALKAEKDELLLQHQRELKAQRDEAAKLKDQLIEARLKHARSLQEAIAAGDAKVEEARKQFAEAEGQLRAELEEDTKLLHLEQDRNAELVANQASLDEMIMDTDAQALKLFLDSQARAYARVTKLWAENLVPDADAPWNSYDHLVALHSWVTYMSVVDHHLSELPEAALKIFKCL